MWGSLGRGEVFLGVRCVRGGACARSHACTLVRARSVRRILVADEHMHAAYSQATPRVRKLRLGRSGCSRGWARRFEEQVQAAGEALRHAEDELMQNLGAQQKAIAYDAKWRERASSAMQR